MARPAWVEMIKKIYLQRKPQIAWFSYNHWGQYASTARQCGMRTVMETFDAKADLARQQYQSMPFGKMYIAEWLRYRVQYIHERRLFPNFDHIISVSEADRRYHAQFVGDERSLLIPNYINEGNYVSKEPIESVDKLHENIVVTTGNFTAFQNRCGLDWFLQQVWPLVLDQTPQAQLQVVGRGSAGLFQHSSSNVEGVGEVPTIAPYLRRAAVAVVPLLHGSGTRFKILEAFACETPVVSTTLGAQGLDLTPGENILLADSGPDLAQAIVGLLTDKPKRARLARNGLNVLKKQYSFEKNSQRIRQLVEALVK
jgi:glycosyltransferase involved in cell wall biosynthesis